MKDLIPTGDYEAYVATWSRVARAGLRELNLDAWAAGRRYLSLACVALDADELDELGRLSERFARLIDLAVDAILDDRDWWSTLAWPWAAIELARQEPRDPTGRCTLFGRFDFLLDQHGAWQLIEFNSDTPSGGREASGYEPAIARLVYPSLRRPRSVSVGDRLVQVVGDRVRVLSDAPRVGIISSHGWLEDMAQATWLGWRLRRAGIDTVVGDVADLSVRGRQVRLRDRRIDALYRFFPIERLYRRPLLSQLAEATIDGYLLPLNGLRAFLAQSKACLAWLWAHRDSLSASDREAVERHLPATLMARAPGARDLLPDAVVKHVNGREGDSVVFGRALVDRADEWEARLFEGGYVVQRLIQSMPVRDVRVDEVRCSLAVENDRVACVGAFVVDGRFGGCYTRLDGPITTARATYVATLRQNAPRADGPERRSESTPRDETLPRASTSPSRRRSGRP